MDLIGTLEKLFIGAIPTAILFWVVYFAYLALVHRPLARAFAERYSRTEGAMARARADIASADAKASEYEQKLKEARIAVFKHEEARRQQMAAARDAALAEARSRAQAAVRQSRADLEKEIAASRAQLQQQAEFLATEIIRTVLRPVAAAPVGGGA
jgi:F-type H+-transporting ATPase subunit b